MILSLNLTRIGRTMISRLSKEAFIKLAEAYSNQKNCEKELNDSINFIIKKYKNYIGFVGPDLIADVILNLLGDDFSYYFYDCNEDFDKFNKNNTLADGTHPKVNNLGELWEFSQKYGSVIE